MPHEKIRSLAEPNKYVQIAWGYPASPSGTGPGHGNEEGHVMAIVERPSAGRMACSVEEIRRRLEARLAETQNPSVQSLVSRLASDVIDIPSLLAEVIGQENLSYAYGSSLDLLAVTVDRKGCNKMISALRRGRDAAYGKDE